MKGEPNYVVLTERQYDKIQDAMSKAAHMLSRSTELDSIVEGHDVKTVRSHLHHARDVLTNQTRTCPVSALSEQKPEPMTYDKALEIVLDLALQNIVDIDMLPEEHARQHEAYDIVFLEREKEPDDGATGGFHLTDPAEAATVIAALRYYQRQGMGEPMNRPMWLHEIAEAHGEQVSLDDNGIAKLVGSIIEATVD